MIRAWKLRNFKSAGQSMKQLEFAGVNILVGANSSGKSTVIQSILVLMQTLLNRDSEKALILNGDLVSLGTVGDLWHNGTLTHNMEIEFVISVPEQEGVRAFYHLGFAPLSPDTQGTRADLAFAEYAWASDGDDDYTEYIKIASDNNVYVVKDVAEELDETLSRELEERNVTLTKAQIRLKHFLPNAVAVKGQRDTVQLTWYDLLADPLSKTSEGYVEQEIPPKFRASLERLIEENRLPPFRFDPLERVINIFRRPESSYKKYLDWFRKLKTEDSERLRRAITKERIGETEDFTDWYSPATLNRFERTAEEFFTSRVRYLSANRVPPTALFDVSQVDSWSEVGIDGRNVAAALNQYGQTQIRYWHPIQKRLVQETLYQGVLSWLKYLELIEDFSPVDYGKLGTYLEVQAAGVNKRLDLTSVGFGTSQVLPIIVQGMLTPQFGTFIVEQPEVHMHPKLQSRLALFFFSLSRINVQCIVETHSEHIVNQLRVLAAQDASDFRRNVRIYFATRSRDVGTTFEHIRLGKRGTIENWPDDFLNEGSKLSKELLKVANTPEDEIIQEHHQE